MGEDFRKKRKGREKREGLNQRSIYLVLIYREDRKNFADESAD